MKYDQSSGFSMGSEYRMFTESQDRPSATGKTELRICRTKATLLIREPVPLELIEYVTEDGKNVFHDWLRSLKDVQARARIRVRLNRIRLGNFGDCKAVGGGVKELRMDIGPGYRVYFAEEAPMSVLLLCGGMKKSQTQDIARACEYRVDYLRRAR